jgi:ketosteroid isomerase-like protein
MEGMVVEFDTLIDRFFASLEAGSVEGVLACYAPDARIWHNFDQITLSPGENVPQLRSYFKDFPTRRYLQVRRRHMPGPVILQQHVLRLIRGDGRDFDWPGCIVFEIRDNQIASLEEYVDLSSFLQRMT